MRRHIVVLVATFVGVSPLLLANPVAAAPSPSSTYLVCQSNSWSFFGQTGPAFTGSPGDLLVISNPSASGTGGDVTWSLPADFSLVSGSLTVPQNGSALIRYGSSNGTLTASAATSCGSSGTSASVNVTITAGGGDSSSTTESAPVLETLTIQTSISNTTCTSGSPTGYRGEWMTLPAADACSQSGPDANPNAKLLGWATNPNFPVAIAQRQVDNGWGAYETFNEDGQMTGVFIPAGGATFVSASTNLYPIWSS